MKRHGCKITRNHKGYWTQVRHEKSSLTIPAVEKIQHLLLDDTALTVEYIDRNPPTLSFHTPPYEIFEALMWARYENRKFSKNMT